MVGTGRFELPTPRTPSECSTRLSHVPTRKGSASVQRRGLHHNLTLQTGALLEVSPVCPYAHVDLQRHTQCVRFLHVFADQRLHSLDFVLGDFEHEFVVYL